MKPIEFKQQTKILLKPQSLTDEECSSLPVYSDGEQCVSLWKMSLKERLKALFFGRAWLYVLSGDTQPPVWIGCAYSVFKKDGWLK